MSTTHRRRTAGGLASLLLVAALGMLPGWPAEPAKAATSDACGALLAKPGGGTWSCTFVDNFNGTTLDATKWVTADSRVSGFYMNGSCFNGTGVSQAGGYLRLGVVRQVQTCTTPLGNVQTGYRGAGVSTFGRFSQTYGRFEARMKFPAYRAAGFHGGFWMNPQGRDYGLWPGSGEIDIAEWFSQTPDNVYPSLHYTGSVGLLDTKWDCTVTRPDLFHTYTLEWNAVGMDFYYDGALCFSREWQATDLAKPAPFDKPFTVALIAASGGVTNAPTPSTPFPGTFVADYVKVWR